MILENLNEKNSEIIVGIHPKLAEDLTENALKTNCLSKLKNIKSSLIGKINNDESNQWM